MNSLNSKQFRKINEEISGKSVFTSDFYSEKVGKVLEEENSKKEEKENHEYLLKFNNVFFINGIYYVSKKELIPAVRIKLPKLNEYNDLNTLEEKVIFFDDMEEINDKIIMSNNLGNFIIFDKNTDNIIYESKKGETIKNIYNNFIIINKPYLVDNKEYTSQLDIDTGEEEFQKYIDSKNFFSKKIILPKFNSIEQFLDSPFFGDVISIAMEEKNYRRKTFSDCVNDADFIDIYIKGGNIFIHKNENIINNVYFHFIKDGLNPLEKLNNISNTIIGRMEKIIISK